MMDTRKKHHQNPPKGKKKFFYFILIFPFLFLVWRGTWCRKPGTNQIAKGKPPASNQQAKAARPIIVATTTSLYDSGLLDALLPVFERETGFRVKVLAVGTGEALEMGRRQAADLLLAHSPEQELKFMQDGYGRSREEFMASDFIIAGPSADEARIRGQGFVEAFTRIARRPALFISRADNSGTHNLEMKIWRLAGINPSGAWYFQTGQGMGESLRLASEKQAYILTDYPTFVRLRRGLQLEILCQDSEFKNVYSAITVENKSGRVNSTGAEALLHFLISEKAQRIIAEFKTEAGESSPLFKPLKLLEESGEKSP